MATKLEQVGAIAAAGTRANRHGAASGVAVRPLLEWGSTGKRQRHVRALAKNLLKLWPALWTFADVPDVEPTNNAAERRGLRAAVIYRKLSLGSRSQGGERTSERLLSVDQTCRLQRRSLYSYLANALTARARGDSSGPYGSVMRPSPTWQSVAVVGWST